MKVPKALVNHILQAQDILLDMRELFRETAPLYDFTPEEFDSFKHLLADLLEKIVDVGQFFGVAQGSSLLNSGQLNKTSKTSFSLEEEIPSVDLSQIDFKSLIEKILFICSSSSARNSLKKIGIEPNQILTTGGPLSFEDLKKLNPEIPATAEQGIIKKIDSFWNQMEEKTHRFPYSRIIFIGEKLNATDELIQHRKVELEIHGGLPVFVLGIKEFKDLTRGHLGYLLKQIPQSSHNVSF